MRLGGNGSPWCFLLNSGTGVLPAGSAGHSSATTFRSRFSMNGGILDRLASVLLRRTGRVHLPVGDAVPDGFVDHLEIDLAERGWLLDPVARSAFSTMSEPRRTAWAGWMLATLDADVGADRPHVPLFRRFPDSTPADTEALYVERVLSFLLQEPDQPCVLCGRDSTVAPVSPCGHLICRNCFDGSDYSACPVCNERIDTDDPFLRVEVPRWRKPPGSPLRMRRIEGRENRDVDATELRDALARRSTPLTPADRDDLEMLVTATTTPGDLSWLPPDAPTRETLATATAIALSADLRTALPQVTARWSTATDIARTLWALSGGDPSLVLPARVERAHTSERRRPVHEPAVVMPPPKVGPLPRPLRRSALMALDALDLRNAVEDVLRHPTVWKRLGERLHPFENASRHPQAAVCFAVLRGSAYPVDSSVGAAIVAAGETGAVDAVVSGHLVRARARTFAALVEQYLSAGDVERSGQLLSTRPGEFLRRLDHLARLTPSGGLPPLAAQARSAAENASAAVALAAYAALTARDQPPPAVAVPVAAAAVSEAKTPAAGRLARFRDRFSQGQSKQPTTAGRLPREAGRIPGTPRRVFFPRGNLMRAWSAIDRRPMLAPGGPQQIRRAIEDALITRARTLPRFDIAVIDAALADYPMPTRARTVAPASRTLPRGARIPIPTNEVLRLFLHWTDPDAATRVDLDLSVLFLDSRWQYVGHCDYTALRFRRGAVHSGDLTSAPPPLGATEFLDLRLPELALAGVAHAVPVVFSYNDVPFDRLTDAFAGFSLPTSGGELFDASRVVLRFDLVGDARVLVPMVVHLGEHFLRWTDVNLSSAGYGHAIQRYSKALGHLAEDMELAFGTERRPSLLQLAAVHAVGRAEQVWLRYPDGTARRASTTASSILNGARQSSGDTEVPELRAASVLFVAADRLPQQVTTTAGGSVLISATGGDPAANGEAIDLLTDL